MMHNISMVALLSVSTLVGCASITGSKNEPVSVDTYLNGQEVAGCNCKLTNDKGLWFVTTPGSLVIQKSYEDLVINCTKEGIAPGSAIFQSKAGGGAWGNILAGGPIGYVIDRSSGAGFDYPTTMNVELGVQNKIVPRDTKPTTANAGSETQSSPAIADGKNEGTATQNTIPPVNTAASNSINERLEKLNELKNKGLISQDEYDKKKKELLDSI